MINTSTFLSTWHTPPRDLVLRDDEIHVWAAFVDQPLPFVSSMLRALSSDERARAERFHFPRDRHRYIVARGILRALLGRYLNSDPADVLLGYLPSGKPILAPEWRGDHFQFNLSHSHELALCAVGRRRRLGIDVEHVRPELAAERIAERFFSPSEVTALRALPQSCQAEAFFACWTRKEAYVKARGEGLQIPLNQFEVVVAPGQPAAILHDEADPQAVSRWSLRSLDLGPTYAAALAVEGQGWQLQRWFWAG
jgi:4'-phosphopantetheinyl transferase